MIDLVRLSVRDHFQQRKWVRQLEDLADQIAERLRLAYEHEFRDMPENERTAALLAVVDALAAADLTNDTLFAVDVDARKLAQMIKRLPEFEPRALAELLGRFSQVAADITEILRRLPRSILNAPGGIEDDEEFQARYLKHVSDTLDELDDAVAVVGRDRRTERILRAAGLRSGPR